VPQVLTSDLHCTWQPSSLAVASTMPRLPSQLLLAMDFVVHKERCTKIMHRRSDRATCDAEEKARRRHHQSQRTQATHCRQFPDTQHQSRAALSGFNDRHPLYPNRGVLHLIGSYDRMCPADSASPVTRHQRVSVVRISQPNLTSPPSEPSSFCGL
jgi:hypothetical protein